MQKLFEEKYQQTCDQFVQPFMKKSFKITEIIEANQFVEDMMKNMNNYPIELQDAQPIHASPEFSYLSPARPQQEEPIELILNDLSSITLASSHVAFSGFQDDLDEDITHITPPPLPDDDAIMHDIAPASPLHSRRSFKPQEPSPPTITITPRRTTPLPHQEGFSQMEDVEEPSAQQEAIPLRKKKSTTSKNVKKLQFRVNSYNTSSS